MSMTPSDLDDDDAQPVSEPQSAEIDRQIRTAFDQLSQGPLPDRLLTLLAKLQEQDEVLARAKGGSTEGGDQ
ncbi:MAG: NepR family anti-sigma factor [Paracoccaceae bacterium]